MARRATPAAIIIEVVKGIIYLFWRNESRVSPNKKDVCRKRIGRSNYEEHPTHFLEVFC